MAKSSFDDKKNRRIITIIILSVILINITFAWNYLSQTNIDSSHYKKPELYWKITTYNNTEPFFTPKFEDITRDNVPEFIVDNGVDTVTIYNITTKDILNVIRVEDSKYLKILDCGHYLRNTTSNLEIIVFSHLNNNSNVIYIIDSVTGVFLWSYILEPNKFIPEHLTLFSKAVYYDNLYGNLIIVGVYTNSSQYLSFIQCINLELKEKIWIINIPGWISASTLISTTHTVNHAKCTKATESSKEQWLVLWTYTGYQNETTGYTYVLLCINLSSGVLQWKTNPFAYTFQRPYGEYISNDLLKSKNIDFNGDNFEDLIIVDPDFIYLIDGYTGAFIKKISFSNIVDAIVGDFENKGNTIIIAESRNGTLSAISLPDGTVLWKMKLHLTELNPVGHLYRVSEGDNGITDILITMNDTITLIKPTMGTITFNKSFSKLYRPLEEMNSQVSAKCRNFSGEIVVFGWTKPISDDLNNDSRNEIIIGLSIESYQPRCRTSQANPISHSPFERLPFFKSTNESITKPCILLVLDLKTGTTIEHLNLSGDRVIYLSRETYKIEIHDDVFIFLFAWSVQGDKEKYIPVVIRFSNNITQANS